MLAKTYNFELLDKIYQKRSKKKKSEHHQKGLKK